MNSVQFVTAVSRSLARLGGLLILVCAFLISLDVVFRNVFKLAIFESYELTGYGIAMATAFGLSWALVTKAHIRIEVIYNLLGIKPRAYLDICALAALSVVAVVLVYYGALVALDNWELGARSIRPCMCRSQSPRAVAIGLALVCGMRRRTSGSGCECSATRSAPAGPGHVRYRNRIRGG